MAAAREIEIEPLGNDMVAVAQCMVIDADVFPHASAQFGSRAASQRVLVARDGARGGGPGPHQQTGQVVGFLAGHARRGVLHIEGIAVDAGFRRRGIARSLLREAASLARAEGQTTLALHVGVANRAALALYESEAFVVTRRMRDFYSPSAFGGVRDAYEMQLRL
jgi:ribosomal protein S18 acetylase RimI-like enzyme